MRAAFEGWAQRGGHIVRRREDKPEEYLVFETQRRWEIWQAALAHGAVAAEPARERARPAAPSASAAALRDQVLNEVLDAFSDLDDGAGLEGVLKVVQSLKRKQKALA